MKPTNHLRFIVKDEIVSSNENSVIAKKVKVLQQFWEHANGKDVAGDMFVQMYGSWLDIPLVKD